MQCKAKKKDGEQCRLNVVEGTEYCRVHQNYEEGDVAAAVQTPYKKFGIVYIGKGSYSYKSYTFRPGRVYEIPRQDADHLLTMGDRFRAA